MGKLQQITKNPLNVRYNPQNAWLKQTGQYKGFCKFSNEVYGIRAAILCILSYYRRGKFTTRQIIETYAPPSENNTEAYIKTVCKWAPKVILTTKDLYHLLLGMYVVESGVGISKVPCDKIIAAMILADRRIKQAGLVEKYEDEEDGQE